MFDNALKYLNAVGKIATDTKTGYKLRVIGVDFHTASREATWDRKDESIMFHVAGEVDDAVLGADDAVEIGDDGILFAKARGGLTVHGLLPWERLKFDGPEQK